MSVHTDEETVKPCIQDRLRSAVTRTKEIFASWLRAHTRRRYLLLILGPVSFLIGIHYGGLFFGVNITGLKTSEIFQILFSASIIYFSAIQTHLADQQYRLFLEENRPIITLDKHDNKEFWFKNKGKLPAWHINITAFNLTKSGRVDHSVDIKSIQQGHSVPFYIPRKWRENILDICIKLEYYDSKDKVKSYDWVRFYHLNYKIRYFNN